MENNKKCSSKEHEEIDAIYYCKQCKINMCNKCENMHSIILKDHLPNKLDKENNLFYEFCTEKNHNNNPLIYFCKNHNKLCCVSCFCKIKYGGLGEHKDCDICLLEEIKNEKKNKLDENLKNLENLSRDFEKSIENLKKISEQIVKKKEELKLAIQNIFTKLRNSLNEREDELLNEVDDKFNEHFFDENIINESEKLPNKIKISLEKGKLIKKEWNNENKLTNLIYDCLNIENCIQKINIIKEKIDKCKDYENLSLQFIINNDIINEINKNIKNFGSIIYNSLKIFNDSLIINKNKEYENFLFKCLRKEGQQIKSGLIYRKSRDGESFETFHSKCDNKGPTLILFKLSTPVKIIIGGYTPLNWDNHSGWKNDNYTFLFNLTDKKIFKKAKIDLLSIYCDSICGPFFPYIGCRNQGKKNMSQGDLQNEFSYFENLKEIIPNNGQYLLFDIEEVEVYKIY